jgi:hypothetical protein
LFVIIYQFDIVIKFSLVQIEVWALTVPENVLAVQKAKFQNYCTVFRGKWLDFIRCITCENAGWSTCRLSHSLMSSESKFGFCASVRTRARAHSHTLKIFDITFSKLQKVIIRVILNTVWYTSVSLIPRIYVELGILMY